MSRITDWDEVPLVLSAIEAAKVLGVSKQSLYREMDDGNLPYVVTRSGRRINKDALIVYLGARPSSAQPETDPQVIHHLEQAQWHHNEAMRLLES